MDLASNRGFRGHQLTEIRSIVGMSTLVESSEVTAVEASCATDALNVVLADGRTVSVPLAWFPRLLDATAKQRADWELIGRGIGIHWEAIDEDILVASLLQPQNYMRLKNAALQRTAQKRHLRKVGRH